MTAAEFLQAISTLQEAEGFDLTVEELRWGDIRLRLGFSERFLRPGGTISGPVMFTLCDAALWGAVWSATGSALMSVTTDMTLHFLRRPKPKPMIAHSRMLRVGRTLCYGEVTLWSEGDPEPVCHATGSYARAQPTGS